MDEVAVELHPVAAALDERPVFLRLVREDRAPGAQGEHDELRWHLAAVLEAEPGGGETRHGALAGRDVALGWAQQGTITEPKREKRM